MFDENTRFGILGLARSGIAAAYKLKELGFSPFLSEFRSAEHIPAADRLKIDFECEFGEHTDRILSCTDVIVSPGIPLDIPILKKIKKNKIEIMSEIELGFLIKDASSKIIAITGSNGKSTTVSLIYDILKKSGYRTILAGNIGDAFTSFPIEKPGLDFIVLELSSFQLDLIKTFRADVAAILNLTPDHLNRYDSFEDYAHAKFQIYTNQTSSDYAIINLDDEIVNNFKDRIFVNKLHFSLKKNGLNDIIFDGKKIIFENLKLKVKNLPVNGPHNIANIMAAVLAVSPFSVQAEDMKAAIEGFKGLEHRQEFVASVKNVKFYNDSKATNTESVKLALLSFKKPVRIIMGGAGKGEDYSVLNPYLKKTAKKVYLLGEAKSEMAETFKNIAEVEIFSDFRSAVEKSFADAHKGDTVLLSPACTSYDMFNNFEERGNFFKQIVRELADGK
ncbi:MAG: UDP-N-acetylmuramoylalanine--D-glutamate ligase [Candidatus Cloacimonas sp. SDB]|nr:MAG: UDP-N-acetylmuramoylalanine--D-glutamate ligase [Candidatus Cloacimonas sp. SDB]